MVSRRVIWVDSNAANNAAIIDLYRQQGVKFDLALNTAQALDLLARERYDLVVSDLGHGTERDSGVRLLRDIRRLLGEPPPVVFCASVQSVNQFGKIAEQEGAQLVTASTRDLLLRMSEVLGI
jgi:CheY-like chemotaxis protein